jgi:glycosyltransferase involved in cell wall biosynthesis
VKGYNFVLVAHKFHTTPEDDLVAYLNARQAPNVLHICHSFSDAPDRRSFYRWYQKGRLVREVHTRDYCWLPEPLIYLKEFLFTVRWTAGAPLKWDFYIGLDGLCSLFGLIVRAWGKVRRVNYWSIDFVPSGRFDGKWKDIVYRWVNRYSALHGDEVWDLTEMMVREKERILRLRPADYRSHRVVPVGVWTNRISRYPFDKCERHTLVFMGHLLEKQGVQLVLEAIPRIVEHLPDFRFKVIGSGSYERKLRHLSTDLGIEQYVNFMGRIERDQDVEEEIARSGAGIAPYVRAIDTYTKFGADPGKIKTYLGCGVPVLVTDVPWIAHEIERRGCGFIISEDPADIAAKVTHLLTDARANQKFRDSAFRFASEFDFRGIFDNLGL